MDRIDKKIFSACALVRDQKSADGLSSLLELEAQIDGFKPSDKVTLSLIAIRKYIGIAQCQLGNELDGKRYLRSALDLIETVRITRVC